VTGAQGQGDDAQFTELFARWENPNAAEAVLAPQVSVPSRMPLEDARLTSDYGMRTHPVLKRRLGHKGVDLAAATGTPIYATADGYVSKAQRWSSYGNFVSIEHGARIQTRYAHMSRIAVAPGTRVEKGDLFGSPKRFGSKKKGGGTISAAFFLAQAPVTGRFLPATGRVPPMRTAGTREDHRCIPLRTQKHAQTTPP
jgi:hypothetical protein